MIALVRVCWIHCSPSSATHLFPRSLACCSVADAQAGKRGRRQTARRLVFSSLCLCLSASFTRPIDRHDNPCTTASTPRGACNDCCAASRQRATRMLQCGAHSARCSRLHPHAVVRCETDNRRLSAIRVHLLRPLVVSLTPLLPRSSTLRCGQDFELVAVDDGSSDESPHILQLAAEQGRTTRAKQQTHGRLCACFCSSYTPH